VTLADFKFTSDPNEAFSLAALTSMNRDDDDESVGSPAPAFGNGDEEDFFGGGNDLNDHDQGGGDYEGFFGDNAQEDGDGDGHAENTSGLQNSGNANSRVVYGPAVPFDPSKSTGSTGLVMAKDDGDSMMLDYFDQGFLKNWAGPEHWKLRRAVRRGMSISLTGIRRGKRLIILQSSRRKTPRLPRTRAKRRRHS
jgi:condensin complex subunit 2